MIREEHGIQRIPCSFRIISEMLPEIHTLEKCDFLISIIHCQIILFSVTCIMRTIIEFFVWAAINKTTDRKRPVLNSIIG